MAYHTRTGGGVKRHPYRMLLLLLLVVGHLIAAAQPKASEDDIEAAYLVNFGKFMRIATGAPRPAFLICVLGGDPISQSLDALAGSNRVGDRPIRVEHAKSVSALSECDIAYLSKTQSLQWEHALADLKGDDVLTVSDAPDFLKHGGMIQFVLVGNHVRFAVNLDAVSRTHIALSSELIRVASAVYGAPPVGVVE